ncbi:hypothetical protein X777_16051 [Ooceraea biroi]|uniref:Uncharacterized protein n=1 Tax=Ooceraea biroi TaxID=2015173 RepID=A0A026WXH8_OOCBI|nr:hypothetical protein X777_16051 [Ooceraea biroi]
MLRLQQSQLLLVQPILDQEDLRHREAGCCARFTTPLALPLHFAVERELRGPRSYSQGCSRRDEARTGAATSLHEASSRPRPKAREGDLKKIRSFVH